VRGVGHLQNSFRRILSLLLILTMLPGWGELIETAEHLLHDGHLPHSTAHEESADSEHHNVATTEHGCTPTSHQCECHVSIPILPNDPPPELKRVVVVSELVWSPHERTLRSRSEAPPRPTPIA